MKKNKIIVLAAVIVSSSIHVFAGTIPNDIGVKTKEVSFGAHLASAGIAGRAEEMKKDEKPTKEKWPIEEKINNAESENEVKFVTKATDSNAAVIETEDFQEDIIYNVSFPASTRASLDPGNISGKGQVFSEQYKVINYGNTDVIIKIKNICITWNMDDSSEIFQDEITASYSSAKKINIDMIWKNEVHSKKKAIPVLSGSPDESVLHLKAANYNKDGKYIGLCDGGTGVFYFTGSLKSDSNIDWENNEISVCFDYEIISAGEDEQWTQIMEEIEERSGSEGDEIGKGGTGFIDF